MALTFEGEGFEYQHTKDIQLALKNYISRDPDGMFKVCNNQKLNNLELLVQMIERYDQIVDGAAIIDIIIALFENMENKITKYLPQLLQFLFSEVSISIQ